MDIRILPANIANMIAAGEVVQRPSSVVKELVENAVDAGATKITVVVSDAGRTLIQVIDNGCGMNPDQAVLCFERHATSKIATAEDLEAIETFGFRGEALASIAAVAEVTLKTRTEDSDVATQVTISDATANDPGRQDVTQVAAPVGSNFIVRNLFYNTPARRKFLKSDAVELKQIISEFTKIALTRIDISFSLTSNDREILRLPAAQSLKYRIQDIFGSACADELFAIEEDTAIAHISGFISRPESARKTVSNQYFFVNGRYFRSPYLHKAVMKAYENLIPEGYAPSYFIYLTVDPHAIDINVHPTKTEIKFEDDNVLFNVLMAAVKQSLGRTSFDNELDFDRGDIPQFVNVGSTFGEYKPIDEPQVGGNADFNPFDTDGFPNQTIWPNPVPKGSYATKPSLTHQDYSKLLDAQIETKTRGDVLLCGKFILSQAVSGILLVDASKAMQRIFYDEFLEALSKEAPVAQNNLFPLEVEVGAENIPLLEENASLLSRLGFEFSVFSRNTILVQAVPGDMMDDKMALSAYVYEMITTLSDEQVSLAGSVYAPLAEKLSKSAARAAVLPSNLEQARKLIDRLYSSENPEFTSDGRKIVVMLRGEDFDKLIK